MRLRRAMVSHDAKASSTHIRGKAAAVRLFFIMSRWLSIREAQVFMRPRFRDALVLIGGECQVVRNVLAQQIPAPCSPRQRISAEHRLVSGVMRLSGTISEEHGHENDCSRPRRNGVDGFNGIGANRAELGGNRRRIETRHSRIAGKVGGNGKRSQHDNACAVGIERRHPSAGRPEGIAVASTWCEQSGREQSAGNAGKQIRAIIEIVRPY
jgi:hypothetical protein